MSTNPSSDKPREAGTFLSMPDPCPHISRLDLISARLGGDHEEVERLRDHIVACPEAK